MNSYLYDSAAFTNIITSFEKQLESYKQIVSNIQTLKETIQNSNQWVQNNIKTTFISKCEEYLQYYTGMITKLEAHINYLKSKNTAMENIEKAFA